MRWMQCPWNKTQRVAYQSSSWYMLSQLNPRRRGRVYDCIPPYSLPSLVVAQNGWFILAPLVLGPLSRTIPHLSSHADLCSHLDTLERADQ